MDAHAKSQMHLLSAVVTETMNYIGMAQHTDRFLRLLAQANVTSPDALEKLDDYECQRLRLPYDMVTSVQKRVRVWKLGLQDSVEAALDRSEMHYEAKTPQQPENPRGRSDTPTGAQTPTSTRSKSPHGRGSQTPTHVTVGNEAPLPAITNGSNNVDMSRMISDVSGINNRLHKIEYIVSQGMRNIEDSASGTKTLQAELHRIQDNVRAIQQDQQRVRDAQQMMFEQMQHQQQQMHTQMQAQMDKVLQHLQQYGQQVSQQQGEVISAVQQVGPGPGANTAVRRTEEQLTRIASKLEQVEAQMARRPEVQEQMRDAFIARFEKIEALSATQSMQQKSLEAMMSKNMEDWLERATQKLDKSMQNMQSLLHSSCTRPLGSDNPKDTARGQHYIDTPSAAKAFDHDTLARSAIGTMESTRAQMERSAAPFAASYGGEASASVTMPQRPPSAPSKLRSFQRGFHPGGQHFPPVWIGA